MFTSNIQKESAAKGCYAGYAKTTMISFRRMLKAALSESSKFS